MLSVILANICIVCSFLIYTQFRRKKCLLRFEHVLVTGGSSGIGLAFAIEAAKRGASVTILARKKEKLDEAKACILPHTKYPEQKICAVSADVTQDYEILQNIINEAETTSGPITMLANSAGTSVCYRFEETPPSEFERVMKVNFIGTVSITQVLVPLMKARKKGKIVFLSSIAGLIGIYGYSAYSASKFALLGMAEALQMEVKPFNITITVSFPPDTDTPGYTEEQKMKILETQLISESGGLFSAHDVASQTLDDTMSGRFMSTVGFDNKIVTTLCCGATPASFFGTLIQVLAMGISRFMMYFYIKKWDNIVRKCTEEKTAMKKS